MPPHLPSVGANTIVFTGNAQVGDKASWKSQDHPFRQDPQLHLTSIPTLMHWKADSTCPGKRLDNQLESVHSASDIKQAIFQFTVKAKEQDA